MRHILHSWGGMTFSDTKDISNIPLRSSNPYYVDTVREVSKLTAPTDRMDEYLGRAFLLLEGGSDINPQVYGQENRYSSPIAFRDEFETSLYNYAKRIGMPVLGICRGHQLMNALEGGTLYQDLYMEKGKGHGGRHELLVSREHDHFVELMNTCPLNWKGKVVVNSMHHQGIDRLAETATAIGWNPNDDLIEACLYPHGVSVQWHPEFMDHIQFVDYMFRQFNIGE